MRLKCAMFLGGLATLFIPETADEIICLLLETFQVTRS